MSNCITNIQREMRCDETCIDYDKPCVIRSQLQNEYCYYKKRKRKPQLTVTGEVCATRLLEKEA